MAGSAGLQGAVAQTADRLVDRYGVQIVFSPSSTGGYAGGPSSWIYAGPLGGFVRGLRSQEILALTGKMDFIIGMRLHALIFAAVQGCHGGFGL